MILLTCVSVAAFIIGHYIMEFYYYGCDDCLATRVSKYDCTRITPPWSLEESKIYVNNNFHLCVMFCDHSINDPFYDQTLTVFRNHERGNMKNGKECVEGDDSNFTFISLVNANYVDTCGYFKISYALKYCNLLSLYEMNYNADLSRFDQIEINEQDFVNKIKPGSIIILYDNNDVNKFEELMPDYAIKEMLWGLYICELKYARTKPALK